MVTVERQTKTALSILFMTCFTEMCSGWEDIYKLVLVWEKTETVFSYFRDWNLCLVITLWYRCSTWVNALRYIHHSCQAGFRITVSGCCCKNYANRRTWLCSELQTQTCSCSRQISVWPLSWGKKRQSFNNYSVISAEKASHTQRCPLTTYQPTAHMCAHAHTRLHSSSATVLNVISPSSCFLSDCD